MINRLDHKDIGIEDKRKKSKCDCFLSFLLFILYKLYSINIFYFINDNRFFFSRKNSKLKFYHVDTLFV